MKRIVIFALLFSGLTVFAQTSLTSFQYSMGFGAGDLGNYINKSSFRGFAIDYRKLIQPDIGIGVDLGWNVFYEAKSYDTYSSGTTDVSGRQYRYNNQFPMLIAADYYNNPGEKITLFVGLGIGTMYSLRNTDMGTWTLEQDAWNFALRPEVGVMYELNPDLRINISTKYYHGFEAGDLPAQGYFTLNVGIVLNGN
jgi:outer membrane protein